MSKHRDVFDGNIERVESLVAVYTMLKNKKEKDSDEYRLTDILRAATVLLHSSFEEYFRSVLREWLPVKAESDTLRQIPLSLHAGRRGEKIYLNDLAAYRNKTINEVIRESVAEDLKLRSFNNGNDIRSWCAKIGISIPDAEEIKSVDVAIQRRHKIVHEADMKKEGAEGKSKLKPIKPADVNTWIHAYKNVVEAIDAYIDSWEEEENGETDF